MSELEFGCGLPPGPDFADLAGLAEELGFQRVWIFDSATLWEDPFVHLALAARQTERIGLATAVLNPSQRSVVAMASGIATVARESGNRLRACLGTGATARWTTGRAPISLDALFGYTDRLRRLLAGEIAVVDGKPVQLLHWPGMALDRPINVPIWLSLTGPRGSARADEVADGIIGPPHPTLPSATMLSGTVLDPGESPRSRRALEAIGPWGVVPWHIAYHHAGAEAVDALPGGQPWRAALEALAPAGHRHLLTFEGHVTHLTERDRGLLEHIEVQGQSSSALASLVGEPDVIKRRCMRLANAGHREIIYTPSGPDVARELTAFSRAVR